MFVYSFVFMALMEYCLVNIVLGDADAPKPPEPPKPESFEFTVCTYDNDDVIDDFDRITEFQSITE